ncbi:MAG: energy transducer TonB [Gallionella sp.]|nr:energy transducer TonB [Gallionella sp.]
MSWMTGQKRELTAQVGTVLTGLFILFLVKTVVMSRDAPTAREPAHLTLIALSVEPEKIVEKPVEQIQPAKHEKAVELHSVATPVIATLATIKEQVVVPVVPSPPPKEKVVPAIVEPQVQHLSNGVTEGAFAQDVRSRIERKKIYPDTARDLGMSGEVEVLYELDRAGNLLKAEIAASSGFKLLDQAALRAVKSASYQKFPEDGWIGAVSKVFRTKLVFSINQ